MRISKVLAVSTTLLALGAASTGAETTTPQSTTLDTPTTSLPMSASAVVMSVKANGSTGITVTVSNGSGGFFNGVVQFTAKSGKRKKSFGKTAAKVASGQIATGSFKLNAAARRFVRIKGKLTIKACLYGQIEGGAKVSGQCKNAVIRKS